MPAALIAFLLLAAAPAGAAVAKDPVLDALREELTRSYTGLRRAHPAPPLYYLSYQAVETRQSGLTAVLGAILDQTEGGARTLDVDARVGSPELDNTHEIKGAEAAVHEDASTSGPLPMGDDPLPLKMAAWALTDMAFKDAQARYTKTTADRAVTAEESDPSADFTMEKGLRHYEAPPPAPQDLGAWKERLRAISARASRYPDIVSSQVSLSNEASRTWFTDSQGAALATSQTSVRLDIALSARTTDGMALDRTASWTARSLEGLPSQQEAVQTLEGLADELAALSRAPDAVPYHGPAVFGSTAAAVLFHEILGHRLEGQRQKLESEGQTFAKKLGQPVTAPFISVYDDPTLQTLFGFPLMGHYRFDDEGRPAERVDLVKDGRLTGFLMSRMPIAALPRSNGHGRRSPGRRAVARMANLVVSASKTVPAADLRELLRAELRRQKKPWGLWFADVESGYTSTTRDATQAFEVDPKLVYRVWADGRPDEPVRGVNIVGTPLTSFTKILAAGDDYGVFNGVCGAESGWVPVSASAPSLLLSEIEVEKGAKDAERPPLLPPPPTAPAPPSAGDQVTTAALAEMKRALGGLSLDSVRPYRLSYALLTARKVSAEASFGSLENSALQEDRVAAADLRVGSPEFDNTDFIGADGGGHAPFTIQVPVEDGDLPLRYGLWWMTDAAFKSAHRRWSQKDAYRRAKNIPSLLPDSVAAPVGVYDAPPEGPPLTLERAQTAARAASAALRANPALHWGRAAVRAEEGMVRFLDSEGRRIRKPDSRYEALIAAETQASDGMPLIQERRFLSRRASDLPSDERLAQEARELAGELRELARAESFETPYIGPVLFEGQAAGEFFHQLLARGLQAPREMLRENDSMRDAFGPGELTGRLGLRVAGKTLSAHDDPLRESEGGVRLSGYSPYDDEGVPGRRITLVEKGILRELPLGRAPARGLSGSNGHARASLSHIPSPRAANLFVEGDRPLSAEALRRELLRRAADFGLPYGVVVRRLAGSGQMQDGDLLPPPAYALKLYPDGREEPLRGAVFDGVTMRALRDVEATGAARHVYNYMQPGPYGAADDAVPASIVHPDILVTEMELAPDEREPDRDPVLPSPLEAKR